MNWELCKDHKLKPLPNSQNAANKEEMPFLEIFNKIADNDNKFDFKDCPRSIEVNIGNNLYLFERNAGSDFLPVVLTIVKEAGSFMNAINCMWLFIEDDNEIEVGPFGPHDFYRFFLCRGDDIIIPSISISETPSIPLPNNIFSEDLKPLFARQSEDTAALVRLCYEKWQRDTLPGRIYTTNTPSLLNTRI